MIISLHRSFSSNTYTSSSNGDTNISTIIILPKNTFQRKSINNVGGSHKNSCYKHTNVIINVLPLLPIIVLFLSIIFLLTRDKTSNMLVEDNTELQLKQIDEPLMRLSSNLLPILYDLNIKIFLPYRGVDFSVKNFTTESQIKIHLQCLERTNLIKLHAKNLIFDYNKSNIWNFHTYPNETMGKADNGNQLSIVQHIFDIKNDIMLIQINQHLLAGHIYILQMEYTALINRPHEGEFILMQIYNESIGGLYQSSYRLGDEKRFVVLSQMQPLDARRLLPCFDEPNFKAEFLITIFHPIGTRAISNAPIKDFQSIYLFNEAKSVWSRSIFEKTPRMATYLLGLAITDFPYKEADYKNIKVRVWVQPSKVNFTQHALNVAVKSLEFFEDYFGIPYPLKKLDILGAPSLRVAAMENWGLIFCRQQNMIYANGIQTTRDKQFVTDVLAHEIAHMWFGNLVTMEWWDDLWLNEGFATIMGMKAADHAENSTSRMSQLFYEHTVKAFRFDQVANQAHALSHRVDSVREITRRFDRITYLKAAAVLRMVEATVGKVLFRRGLKNFLNKFAYKNARSEDLLKALNGAIEGNEFDQDKFFGMNFTLSDLLHTWTYQTGFPLVRLNYWNSSLVLASQEQFFSIRPEQHPNIADGNANRKNATNQWKIPLFLSKYDYNYANNSSIIWLLENQTAFLPRKQIIDIESYGYYRVQYDSYEKIIDDLRHLRIPLASRSRLLEDTFTLARMGFVPFEIVFRMCRYLVNETEYLPFLVFNNHLQVIHLLLRNHKDIGALQRFIFTMLKPFYHKVFDQSITNDIHIRETMKEFIMVQLCYWNYPPCIKISLDEFKKLQSTCRYHQLSDRTCNLIPPELRGPIYSTAIKHGSSNDFNFLKRKYFIEEYDSERNRIMSGLISTQNISLVENVIMAFIGNRKALEEDFYGFALKFVRSPILNEVVIFFKTNFSKISKKIPHGQIMKVILTYVTKWMHTEKDLLELDIFEKINFKELHSLRLIEYLQSQRIEIQTNKIFVSTHADKILHYLKNMEHEWNP